MNIVALVGNLATDPEYRVTEGKKGICTFRLAVSRSDGQTADVFTVVAWERQAEVCRDYLSVGRRIAVDGRLHHSTWQVEKTDGTPPERRSKVEVIAHRIELLGRPKREEDGAAPAASVDAAEEVPVPEFAVV